MTTTWRKKPAPASTRKRKRNITANINPKDKTKSPMTAKRRVIKNHTKHLRRQARKQNDN